MKNMTFASLVALCLLSLAAPPTAAAQTTLPSASGTYQFSLGDVYTKYLDFSAAKQADGSTAGRISFNDEAVIKYQDVDGVRDPALIDGYKGFYITADVDDLVVNRNQAVMSGTIRDSNILDLIGQRVLLTVEDNGDNTKTPDRVTWGVYRPVRRGWVASDAELKDDPGVGLRWLATDAERKDDKGVVYPKQDEPAGTRTFALGSYAYADATRGVGDITVKP